MDNEYKMNKFSLIRFSLPLIMISALTASLSACVGERTDVIIDGDDNQLTMLEIDESVEIEAEKEKMAEQLGNHYARLASKHSDSCPKLLQKEIDSQLITRKKERLKGQYCDYYIYPKQGQVLSITSSDPGLEITLRMPKFHNFANGSYFVDSNRRHVIRVEYSGSSYKPNDFIYNINFNLTPVRFKKLITY